MRTPGNALISVWDKTHLPELARFLVDQGVQIYSTGKTKGFLEEQGIPCQAVDGLTEWPELFRGRVKTLHPRVFGGILADRKVPADLKHAEEKAIPLFDVVVVNLYPFESHRNDPFETQVEYVDVGGPSLLRAAAKNHASVAALAHPEDYAPFIQAWKEGRLNAEFRKKLAVKVFQRTSAYDAAIAGAWGEKTSTLPDEVSLQPRVELRYGENPHQKAFWVGEIPWKQLQGKDLSYNNLLDSHAALSLGQEFSAPAAVIIKHMNPCGAAVESSLEAAFEKAWASDPLSAFGGIVFLNREVSAVLAKKLSENFLEVILAPKFSLEAVEILKAKKNLRLLEVSGEVLKPWEIRSALGGYLIQDRDKGAEPTGWKVVTTLKVPVELEKDLAFAWTVVHHTRSNAIVIARGGQLLGSGAGQTSRVEAVHQALKKAEKQGGAGSVLASDAFFPFPDSIELLKGSSVRAVIQPGGSVKDESVIEACERLGIAMVFTGQRHFKH